MVPLQATPLLTAKSPPETSFWGVIFASGPDIRDSQSGPSPQDAPVGLQRCPSRLPVVAQGEQPSKTSLSPAQLL